MELLRGIVLNWMVNKSNSFFLVALTIIAELTNVNKATQLSLVTSFFYCGTT